MTLGYKGWELRVPVYILCLTQPIKIQRLVYNRLTNQRQKDCVRLWNEAQNFGFQFGGVVEELGNYKNTEDALSNILVFEKNKRVLCVPRDNKFERKGSKIFC